MDSLPHCDSDIARRIASRRGYGIFKMSLIAFCGYMGTGKTFAADYLVEEYGYTRVKFAGPLKNMLRTMGLTDEHIEGELKDKPCDLLDGKTPRWAMQSLGTEWGRDLISPNLWGNLWEKEVQELLNQHKQVVVDDCRFDNEVARVKRMKGLVILLTNPTSEEGAHPSETLPDNPDITLVNQKNEHLKKMLDTVIGQNKSLPKVSQNGWAI